MTGNSPVPSDPAFGGSPALPYSTAGNPTTGSSAPGPSGERAVREAADGTAADRQARIIALLSDAGPIGMAWFEIADRTGWHHGQVSGALSTMHKADRVASLRDGRRSGCGVYVLPQYIQGRRVRPFAGQVDDVDTGIHEQIEAYARMSPSAPREQARPALTGQEKALLDMIRRGMKPWEGKRSMPMRPGTVLRLIAIIERLGGAR